MTLKTRSKVDCGALSTLESGALIYDPTPEESQRIERNEIAELLEGPKSVQLEQGGFLRVVRVKWEKNRVQFTGWAPALAFQCLDTPRPKLVSKFKKDKKALK